MKKNIINKLLTVLLCLTMVFVNVVSPRAVFAEDEQPTNDETYVEPIEKEEDIPEEVPIPEEENEVYEDKSIIDYINTNNLQAVLISGDNNESTLVIEKLKEKYDLEEELLSEINDNLFVELNEIPLEDKTNEKDDVKVNGYSIKWIDTDEDTVQLDDNTNELTFQINYSLHSENTIPEDSLIITIPDTMGEIVLPYEEDNKDNAFSYRHEGNNYILYNNQELESDVLGYIQVKVKNVVKEETTLNTTIEVVLEDDVIGLKSNDLKLVVLEKETEQIEPQEEETKETDLSDTALLGENEFDVIPEDTDQELLQPMSLSLPTRRLLNGGLKAAPGPQTPVTADHITIEKITIRWVSPSSGSEESAMYDDLNLVPTNDIVPNQQWQLDVAFSGKDEIKAGDLEIVVPAYIWLDRDDKEPGIVTVAVPREGEPGNYDFAWRRVGDTIVITNKKNLSAASKYMIQGTFRMTSPDPNSDPEYFTSTYAHQMVDGKNRFTDDISNPLFGVVNVTTPNTQEVISMTSNEIFATIDTHVEVANAAKTSYDKYSKRYNVFYDYQKADIPEELLPENPEEYLYIKWYIDGRATGNQPFTMISEDIVQDTIYKVEGTTEIPIQAKGLMLGATDTFEGTVKSTDGETIRATLYNGFTEDDKAAYVWTAYKLSYFEGRDASFKVYNTHTVTVTGIDDQEGTSASATASVAIRLPIVWTIKKEWIYNEDKYDTPLDVIKSRQPETLDVWLDNESTGKKRVFTAKLSDENEWTVEYEDDGVVADYEAYEHSYEVTRHMHGEDGVSIDIVSGKDDIVYTDDGRWYQKYWGYDHKSTKYDEETHTWTFVNDYHEGIIGGSYDNFEVSKIATNHRDENQKSTADKDLNLLRNGKETTSINYNVHTGTFCLGHTSEPGAEPWETDKHGKRYVTLELHDYGEYFESRKLRNDEFRMATVRMQLPDIYKWVPEEEGSTGGEWVAADPVPVSLYARGGDATDWTLYAIMNVDGSINTYNGATVSGTTVNLPEGMNETLERIRTNGGRAYLDYNVGVILFPSQDIQEKIEEIFESTDYAKAHSFNYVTGRLLDDDGHVLGELERYDRTYLHGRLQRLAVDLDKKTTFIENDKTTKQFVFKNEITLNQQSNIIDPSEFDSAFNDYDIPGSKSGTFYDLLPEGMIVDTESIQIKDGTAKMIDVIENYKDTGRQLLIVKADIYENKITRDYSTRDNKRSDDSYPNITDIDSTDKLYGTKATLVFNSLYSFDEARNRGITNMRNTAAYEADEDVFGNNPEWSGEKDAPTGERHKESLTEVEDYLRNAMTNLDSEKDNPNFVYAGDTYRMTEADFDGLSSLRKYVQAAGDAEDHWVDGLDNSVYVYEGGKYNYKIVLTSDTDTVTKDIILLDSIEYYTPMEITDKGDSEFKVGQIVSRRELEHVNANLEAEGKTPATAKEVWCWKGYFKSVDVSQMRDMGVDVVVYYSTVPDLDITHEAYNPDHTKEAVPEKLADKTVWSTELPDDPSKVTAIAFDCRKKEDGSDFELHSQESLIAYVHMQSPTWEQQPEAFGEEGYNNPLKNGWAYNNVYMDITQINEQSPEHETHSYDHYDYTKVGIWTLDVEVKKVWEDKDDNDRKRPEEIEVHLIREGVDTGRSLTLNEGNNWSGVFKHVLMFDEDGKRIYYTLNENPVDEYTSRVEYDSQNMVLINHRETEKVDIPFTKVWASEEATGWETNIPKSIRVKLYADGVFTGEAKTVRADSDGNWSGIFTGMDKYKDGVEVVYTIEEDPVTDFITTIDQENKTITNTYYPYGDLTVEKKVINGTAKALLNEFTYTLTLKDSDGESVPNQFDYVIVDSEGTLSTGKIGNGGTFTLKDQQKITVKGINAGVRYEVRETSKPGFTITRQVASTGTISSNESKESKFENTYHTYGSAEFNLNKTLVGKDLEKYQFRFEVLDKQGTTIRLGSNKEDGSVTFGAINYTEADDGETYTYRIVETNRGKGGYTYDSTVYTAEVRPVDNGDGTMTVTVVYKNGETVVDKVEFKNEYEAKGKLEFKAWKVLEGRELKNDEFTFELKDSEGNVRGRATNKADGTITFDPIEFDQDHIGKEYDFIMSEVKGTDDAVNYSNEQYNFHVVVADNGDGTLSFAQDVREITPRIVEGPGREVANKGPSDAIGIAISEVIDFGDHPKGLWISPSNESFYPDEEFYLNIIHNSLSNNNQSELLSLFEDGLYSVESVAGYRWYYETCEWLIYYAPPVIGDITTPVFTNDLKDGALSVEKHVTNPEDADPEQTFKFRVEFEGRGVEGLDLNGEISPTGAVSPSTNPDTITNKTNSFDNMFGLFGNVLDVFNPVTVYAEDGDIDYGTYDGVDWRITSDYELIIGKEGETQNFTYKNSRNYGNDFPWGNYREQIVKVTFAGPVKGAGDARNMFSRFESMTVFDPDHNFDTSGITDMGTMFYGCSNLTSLDLSYFNTGNVTTTRGMFRGCSSLENLNITGWDLSKVDPESANPYNDAGLIREMFRDCSSLKEIDLSCFENVVITGIDYIFYNCSSLTSLDLSSVDTSHMTYLQYLFYGCSSLKSLDISSFDTLDAVNLQFMFEGCSSLEEVILSERFSFAPESLSYELAAAKLPTPPDKKTTRKWIREDGAYGPYTPSDLKENYTGEMAGVWIWEYNPIAVYDSSDKSLKFYNAEDAKTLYQEAELDGKAIYTGWDTIENYYNVNQVPWYSIREEVESIEVVSEGIQPLCTKYWFYYFTNVSSIDISKLDTSEVINMDNMFAYLGMNTELDTLDLGDNFDTSSVTDMSNMFMYVGAKQLILGDKFDTSNVEKMGWMFEGSKFEIIDLGDKFDTSKVTRMYYMFDGTEATTIDLGDKFDTSKVETMDSMFSGAKVKRIYLSPKISVWNMSATLPTPPLETTSGKWTREDGTTEEGFDPEQLRTLYVLRPEAYSGWWIWEPKAINYTVKFDGGSGSTGSMADDDSAVANKAYTIPANKYVKFGNKFNNWNTASDGTGEPYADNGVIRAGTYEAGDIVTLYAQWQPIEGLTNLGNGVYEFELQDGMKMTIDDIPAGVTYRVYEETPDGWVLVSKSDDNGQIEPLKTAEAKFTNEYQPGTTSVQFNGVKHLDGDPADGFTFQLIENSEVKQTKTCTNGMIQFDQITYTSAEAGTHVYTIKEVPGNDAAINYDNHEVKVTVVVTDNGDGTLSKEVKYDPEDGILFKNKTYEEYLYGSLIIQKLTDIPKDDTFTFQVNFTNLNGMPYEESLTYTLNNVEKTVTPDGGIVKIDGVKADDLIKFNKLPKGIKFAISEVDIPDGWAIQTVTGEMSGTIAGNDTHGATFTNSYSASGEVRLEAHKRFDGDTLTDGQFTFELYDVNGDTPTLLDQQSNGALDNNPTFLDDNDQSVDNPWYKTGLVTFDPINYTLEDAGKTYTYKIKEVIPADPGIIIYDEHEETVTVKVTDVGGGILNTEVTYDSDGALFTNTIESGQLVLRKEISNYTKAAKDTEFNFKITLNDEKGNELDSSYDYIKHTLTEVPVMGIDEEGNPYDTGETDTVSDIVEGTMNSGDTIALKAYEFIEILGLPHGATYIIEEEDVPGWTLSESDNAEGTIEARKEKEAIFKNVYTTEGSVNFEASKTLIGREITADTYKFIVEDTNGEVVDFAYANPDGTIVFNGIDYTAEDDGKTFFYYIKEEMGKEEDISYDGSVKEVKVKVNDNGQGELVCEVTYPEEGMEFVNEVSYSLKVDKDVTGEKADPDRKFTFTLSLEGLGERKIAYKRMEGNIEMGSGLIGDFELPYKFTLSSKETMIFSKLPTGVKYTLVEENDDYYTAEESEFSNTIANENLEVLFVNEINWFDVEFDKVNEEGTMISGAKLAIYQDEELVEEWTTDGKTHKTKLLPGDYVLKEEKVSDEKIYVLAEDIPFTVNIDGTVKYNEELYEKAKVTMVDEYTKIDVSVIKDWDDHGNQDGIRPDKITIELYGNGELVETRVITKDDNWRTEFRNLPKYKNEKELTYTVKEINVNGYSCRIVGDQEKGFKITNKHTPERPSIPKTGD